MQRTARLAAGALLGATAFTPLLPIASAAHAAPGDPLTVNLFHINDSHSHLESQSATVDLGTGVDNPATPANESAVTYELGGFARVDAMIKQLRDVDHAGENNVTIHAGDAITGTAYYTLFDGEADAAMMNETCFDIFELGNHEFDDGDGALVEFLDFLNNPDGDGDDSNDPCNTDVLGANVVPAAGTPLNPDPDPAVTADDYLQPYVLRDFGTTPLDPTDEPEFMVGFVGLDIADKTMNSSSPLDTTEFLDELETAQQYIDELEAEGITNVVLVTHYGYENDLALAAGLTGVDAIVGGDSHSLLGDPAGYGPFAETTDGAYPTVVQNLDGDDVCVAQAWQYSAVVGELELTFQNGSLTASGCNGTPHLLVDNFTRAVGTPPVATPVSADEQTAIDAVIAGLPNVTQIAPNPDADAVLETFRAQVDELEQQVIGTATEPLCLNRLPGDTRSGSTCRIDQVATSGAQSDVNGGFMQQIVADAFLARSFEADLAIQNAGGVRIAVPAGDITMADAIEVLPFANTLVNLELTGQQVIDVLEDAAQYYVSNPGANTGAFPYGAAVRYDVDLTKPEGERYTNVEVRDRETGEWSPINLTATYTVVTNDFIAQGQDGYTTFGEIWDTGNYVDTGILYTQGLVDWIEQDAPKNAEGVPQVSVPAPEDFSIQSYVPVTGELMAPVNPTRVLDTRTPNPGQDSGITADGEAAGGGIAAPGTPITLRIGGRAGVPPTATAVSLNIAVTEAVNEGYLTVWPTGVTKPLASSINFGPGTSVANSIVVPIGADGTIQIEAGVSATHVVADVTGWSASDPDFTPLTPARLLDTRPADGSGDVGVTIDNLTANGGVLTPGTTLELDVEGRGGVPEGTDAVALNLTVTGSAGNGYLTAWPCNGPAPLASTINYVGALAIANSVVVPLSDDGTVCITSGVSATHVVADVTGAYAEEEENLPGQPVDEFGGLTPARLLDTRAPGADVGITVDGLEAGEGTLAPGESLELTVNGRGGVPAAARLVALNLVGTEVSGPGYLTVWPCTEDRPLASSLNYTIAGTTVANSIIVPVSPDGTVCVYSGVANAHVVADVTAFYL